MVCIKIRHLGLMVYHQVILLIFDANRVTLIQLIVSQCPIAPGSSFTYTFQAGVYGTSWYHSHYSAQYADGLFGAMIIHGPTHIHYDIELGPILLVRDRNHAYEQETYLTSLTITTLVILSLLSASLERKLFQIQTTISLMAR